MYIVIYFIVRGLFFKFIFRYGCGYNNESRVIIREGYLKSGVECGVSRYYY